MAVICERAKAEGQTRARGWPWVLWVHLSVGQWHRFVSVFVVRPRHAAALDIFHNVIWIFCHWQERPQVSFLSRQKNKHVFVATKHVFVTTKLLWRQTYFCRDRTFAITNICHDKHNFVTTKHLFCHDKSMLVATKLLSWQTRVLSRQNTSFASASILLSWQKTCFVATNTCLWRQNFCRNKMILEQPVISETIEGLSRDLDVMYNDDARMLAHTRTRVGQERAKSYQSRAQELCESRGGRPGLPSLISLRFLWT